MTPTYQHGGAERFAAIADLWAQQRLHHIAVTTHFRAQMEAPSFAARCRAIERRTADGALRVDTVTIEPEGPSVGYCITSLDGSGNGEIQSLFVIAEHRGRGLGSGLLTRALDWLRERGAQRITAGVAAGNERVLDLYARHGLHPRTTILEVPPT